MTEGFSVYQHGFLKRKVTSFRCQPLTGNSFVNVRSIQGYSCYEEWALQKECNILETLREFPSVKATADLFLTQLPALQPVSFQFNRHSSLTNLFSFQSLTYHWACREARMRGNLVGADPCTSSFHSKFLTSVSSLNAANNAIFWDSALFVFSCRGSIQFPLPLTCTPKKFM